MARFRRRRRMNRKSATAFAPAERRGKVTAWEAIAGDHFFNQASSAFPNIAYAVAAEDIRYRVLIPANVTRGAVTLTRVRGDIAIAFNKVNIDAAGGQALAVLPIVMQLVPVRNGNIVDDAVLDPSNAADLESNRIIWRRTYVADMTSDIPGTMNAVRVRNQRGPAEVDIKNKRKFDRATWALILTINFNTVEVFNLRLMTDLRALFATTDGV